MEKRKQTTKELLDKSLSAMSEGQRELYESLSQDMRTVSRLEVEQDRTDHVRHTLPESYQTFFELGYFRDNHNLREFMRMHTPELYHYAVNFFLYVLELEEQRGNRWDLSLQYYRPASRTPEEYLENVTKKLKDLYDYRERVYPEMRVLDLLHRLYTFKKD